MPIGESRCHVPTDGGTDGLATPRHKGLPSALRVEIGDSIVRANRCDWCSGKLRLVVHRS
jgi:hypothetical protein